MKTNTIKLVLLTFAMGLFQWMANAAEATKEINGKTYRLYTVKKGETLFGICKSQNTTVAELEKVNPSLKNGLKSDSKIYVPAGNASSEAKVLASASTTEKLAGDGTRRLLEHEVKSGETLTSIAKKYNTSIGDLKARNESALKNGLKSGYTLKVYQNSNSKNATPAAPLKKETTTAKESTPASTPAASVTTANNKKKASKQGNETEGAKNGICKYKVKKGETLYAICKRQGCSVADAELLNPSLKKRTIIEGEYIVLPDTKAIAKSKDESGNTAHVVKKGETLFSIANTYNVTTSEIEALNPGVKKDGIKAGKPLIMPSTSRYIANKNSDKNFEIYKVEKDETVFSISKKLGVSQSAVTANNSVKNGIKEGQFLAIPQSAKEKEKTGVASIYRQNAPATEKNSNIAHTILPGETMFSICQTYRVTDREIYDLNPEAKEGLKAGKIIFIPRSTGNKSAWNSSLFISTQGNNKVNVAIILPFSANDGAIDNNTDKFLEFYQGALLAIKKLKENNVWVNVYAYNSGKTEADIKKLLANDVMKTMDLIIGPAYKAQFQPISNFALENNIKVIVPFSSRTEEMKSNPNFFLINAPKSRLAQESADFLVNEFKDKNVVMVKFEDEKKNDKKEIVDSIAARLRQVGTNVKEVDFKPSMELKDLMKEDGENIILTTSTDQVALTQLIPSINVLLVNKINAKIFGYTDWAKYQTISKDLFVAETYMCSVFDMNFASGPCKEFIGNFRKYFGQEPGNTQPMYGALGYDIMLYFGSAVASYGKNFTSGLNNMMVPTIQCDFQFKRYSEDGGFYNSSLSISRNNGTEGHIILNK